MVHPDPKISVVVPAYNSADTLERLLASLDAQTLPQDEFEVVVVDDGSSDGTFELLQQLQQDRPNLRAKRIAPSGWASRPRNVGTELARGEYVLYMDSDDTLYPDALRRCHEYATEQGADILNPKESQSKQPWWGMATYEANIPDIRHSIGIAGLLPMTPHKVFRRAFLVEHGLRFEETPPGERILWEDVRMVLAAYRAARVVSVLADTAVYHWHSNAGSISKSYGAHSAEFWDQVEGLLRFIHALFPGDEFVAERETMLLQQYKVRLLGRFTTFAVDATTEEMAAPFARLRQLQEQYMPLELDAGLGILDRSRAVLVRAGRLDLLLALVRFDKSISNSCSVPGRAVAGRRAARDQPDHLGAQGRRRLRRGGRPHPAGDARGGRCGAAARAGRRHGRAALPRGVGLGAGSRTYRHLGRAHHLLDPVRPHRSRAVARSRS